jgi:hypothetical protein
MPLIDKQVSIRYKYKFLPLPESKFRHIIKWLPVGGRPAPQLTRSQMILLFAAFASHDAETAHKAAIQLTQCFRLNC